MCGQRHWYVALAANRCVLVAEHVDGDDGFAANTDFDDYHDCADFDDFDDCADDYDDYDYDYDDDHDDCRTFDVFGFV